ncbi:LOW QUALITY PROTEIN: uncharacterized protein EMH_0059210 [Eimeria mitis]|uniref:Transmembrane protein n=1 Tax=Eimeria mitis TaxID=44415 RepID=U6KDH3_9EIME|nr:LOW QUALITY PROTEIN: uncharacterized protein EMH_0059210 [Eimeria mitis]CDJ36070.1 hypothetical protein, conserved [Eimeria mitis]
MQRSIDTPDAPTKLAQLKDSTGLFLEEENTREGLARPGALRRPRRSPRLTVYHAWAVLLSTLAVLVILTKCARSRYILGGKAGDGRQLAGNDGESDEDPDLAAILELCVEMEQEHGQSMQPYGMPPQMYWGDSQPWQHVPGSREDLHTGAQSTSSPEWDGSVPSSSAGTPGFHQGPAMQTDYSFLTRSADILEGNEYLDEGPSTSAGVSTMLLPYADGSLPHQGPGTQTDYSFLRGSADMRGSPESLGEGPSTSAGFSSMLLPSADGSVSSGSAGYGSSALPAAGSAPSSFQGFHVPSSAAPLNVPLVFDEFNAGLMLPQAKPRAQQAAAAHVVQPTPERSAFPAIVEALSAGKRKSEEQPASTPAAPSKKSRASSKRRARKSRYPNKTTVSS